MEIWSIWVVAALVLVIVEIFTSGFAVICLSIGCVGGAIAAAVDMSLEWQLLLFAIMSMVALLVVRPILKRIFFSEGEKVRTNADAFIGRRGVVCNDIPRNGEGRVVVDGVDWKAVSCDGEALQSGDAVEIVAIDSVVLTVKKL